MAQPGPVVPDSVSEGRLNELRTKAEPGEDQRTGAAPMRSLEVHRRVHVCVGIVAHTLLLRRPRFTSSSSVISE